MGAFDVAGHILLGSSIDVFSQSRRDVCWREAASRRTAAAAVLPWCHMGEGGLLVVGWVGLLIHPKLDGISPRRREAFLLRKTGLATVLVETQPATWRRRQSSVAHGCRVGGGGGEGGPCTRAAQFSAFQIPITSPSCRNHKKNKIIELRQLECGVPWRAGECYPGIPAGGVGWVGGVVREGGRADLCTARLSGCSGIIDRPLIVYSCDCLQQAKGDRINNKITSVQCKTENEKVQVTAVMSSRCVFAKIPPKNYKEAFSFHREGEKKD